MKRTFNVPIYNLPFTVCCGQTIEKAGEFVKVGEDIAAELPYCNAFTLRSRMESCHHIVLVEANTKPGFIAHEAKHVVNGIFKYIGQKLDLGNDEAECYLLGWIVEKIHQVVNEYRKKHGADNLDT